MICWYAWLHRGDLDREDQDSNNSFRRSILLHHTHRNSEQSIDQNKSPYMHMKLVLKAPGPLVDGTWCVDPLDGTADYCSFEIENPCYTCNIGLIMNGDPVFGIFSVPETGIIYYGIKDVGSFKINDELCLTYADGVEFPGERLTITKKDLSKSGIRVATSASHLNHETKHFIDERLNDVNCVCFASSLKFGAVADNSVDIYPRCGPTCEWDTCAADAVVRYAGGGTYIYNPGIELEEHKEMLKYNKPYLLNPHFIVF